MTIPLRKKNHLSYPTYVLLLLGHQKTLQHCVRILKNVQGCYKKF